MKIPANGNTKVKIFHAFGKDDITKMEGELNDFLSEPIDTISVTPQMCSIGDWGSEIYQAMTVTVLYQDAPSLL
ncbi:hypothetical protein [Paenochrobactrum pullorum]|uniref:hypothetical protein n=1 Tax=Paenochrobactrum pullorum TaxID=1324351 RepID=UPI0035BBE82D